MDTRNIAVALLIGTLSACTSLSSVRLLDGATGAQIDLVAMADRFATRDVVFLGEEHDNDYGHAMQREMLEQLHSRRPDLILSLEMFERDVQPILDDYLGGGISEAEFLENSRPWPNYKKHYSPLVEYARAEGLAVLAANIPRPLARIVSKEGPDAIAGEEFAASRSSAPEGLYKDLFFEIMTGGDDDHDVELVTRFYQAQCYKDDTMAESIAIALDAAWQEGRRPLVVHVCGKFHSDFGEGTVSRLRERIPQVTAGIISMNSEGLEGEPLLELLNEGVGQVLWCVPSMDDEED